MSTGCPPEAELAALTSGALGREAVEAIGKHVGGCEACTRKLDELIRARPRKATLAEAFGAEPRLDITTLDLKGDVTEQLAAVPRELVPVTPGERLERYVVLEQIGRGGMAVVYKAFDPELDRNVAMKVMFPEDGRIHDAEIRGRFVREAQAMARVSHPNVIEVYDAGTVGERAFITMKLVEGGNLREWARTKRTWREKLEVYLKAGRGLAAAHAAGLVHRDFKPSNVLVDKQGGVFVTDFGLARLASSLEADAPTVEHREGGMLSSDITRAGAIAGTEGFIAPELYAGRAPDTRSDQFGFCVALYTTLFAQPPFAPRVRDKSKPPPPLIAQADPPTSDVPAWLRKIVRRGLSIDREQRYPSMDALLEALGKDPAVARKKWLTIGAGTVVIGGAFAFVLLRGGNSPGAELCAGAELNLDGIWDGPTQASIEGAFERSGLPFQANAWQAASTKLEDYGKQWVAMRTEACTATRVRGEQSDEVLSLRMLCLDRRLQEFGALTSRLKTADKKMVERSPTAAAALTDLAMCANVATLKDVLRPPADPAIQKRIEGVTGLLAGAKALDSAGKFADAMPLAKDAAAKADAIDYAPLRGEAHLRVGLLHNEMGDPKAAELELMEAIGHAERGRDDRTRLRAAIALIWSHGVLQDHHATAVHWETVARGILDRIGGDTDLLLTIQNHKGGVLFGQGKFDELLAHQRTYVENHEKFAGADHPETVLALINLGSALAIHGDYVEAAAVYRKATAIYERTMGTKYYRYGLARNNLADILAQQGKPAEALPMAEEASALLAAARGPSSMETVASQHTVAGAILASGDHARAIAYATERLPEWRKHLGGDPSLLAEGVMLLARAHVAAKQPDKALALVDDMLVTLKKSPQDAMNAALLMARGEALIAANRPGDAMAVLAEAVASGTKLGLRPIWLAEAKFGLARVLRLTGGDEAKAKQLATEAKRTFDHAGIARASEVAEFLAAR